MILCDFQIKAEIERVEGKVKRSATPQAELQIAWLNALSRYDHCDDMRTAIDDLCTHLINKYCKSGTTKSELLKPYLDKIMELRKEQG